MADAGWPACAAAPGDDPLAGAVALFVVCLDASSDGWTAAMRDGLRAAAGPAARVLEWRDGMPDAELSDVELVFCWNPPPGLLRRLPRLRLVASLGAGVDHCTAEHATVASAGVSLVRCVDPLAARRLADYVLWAALHLSRRMEEFAEAQARCLWDSSPQSADPGETRVGVMGLGAMGCAAAECLARNGFAVSCWSRTGAAERPPPRGVPAERVFAGDEALEAFLSAVDVLVCALPLTDATRGLLSARRLRSLARGASFINVGRADCVVHDDLLAALDDGHLSRAVLDVAPQEPLPGACAGMCVRTLLTRRSPVQRMRRSGGTGG
jgi:glyoxylate/hydroxypyruvate reductase A